MSLISIPTTSEKNGVVFYHITITLPLRSLSVDRRYSEFLGLVKQLCLELGISQSDFPYRLPPKDSLFSKKSTVVLTRKAGLTEFLNKVIQDRELQNRQSVHSFLQLPLKFEFTSNLFKSADGETNDTKFVIDEDASDISSGVWLSYLRNVRYGVSELSKEGNVQSKLSNREQVMKSIKPNIEKLASALTHLALSGLIDQAELRKRTTLLKEVLKQVEDGIDFKPSGQDSAENPKEMPGTFGLCLSSPFSSKLAPAEESSKTIDKSNHELLQQQQQVHRDQDAELLQLRSIIARQREIGETINQEVTEQNELLDGFSEDVERSARKLKVARHRAKGVI